MRPPCCLCISPYQLWMAEPIFMKLGMYIMAPEPISVAYFMNPYRQSVCLYVYPLTVATQQLTKNSLILAMCVWGVGHKIRPLHCDIQGFVLLPLLGKCSVQTLPQQWTHKQQQRNCWTCSINESRPLVLPRTSYSNITHAGKLCLWSFSLLIKHACFLLMKLNIHLYW
jgi:hypothetical protein